VILMPADLCAALAATGQDVVTLAELTGLAEAFQAPLERMMDGA
jgi:pyocin large subunit-like protein